MNSLRQQPIEVFVAQVGEFETLLNRLQTMLDDHFSVDPDDVKWGDVGDMGHRIEVLKQITDAYFKEGEFAK
ncbi:hypothetical protein [Chitinilyticum aquatile]|uniref:hypothetical protein n=1 Tax=Chitinilyticum aquatile TaxID=362520 RepID=UPI000490BDA3|nr:hypothetical protein [Chitinilyticum aquatile]